MSSRTTCLGLEVAKATKNLLCLLRLHFPFGFMCCFHLSCLDKNNNQSNFPQLEEIMVSSYSALAIFISLSHIPLAFSLQNGSAFLRITDVSGSATKMVCNPFLQRNANAKIANFKTQLPCYYSTPRENLG